MLDRGEGRVERTGSHPLLRYRISVFSAFNSDAGWEMFCSTRLMVLSVGLLARCSTRAALLMVWQSWNRFGISLLAA